MGDVLDEAGADWRGLLRTDAHDVASARAATASLLALAEPPTAIVAGNNRVLLGAVEELATRERADRPAVIGFDDVEWARVLGITVVTGDVDALGRRAAQFAMARLNDRSSALERASLPMRLIVRAPSAW